MALSRRQLLSFGAAAGLIPLARQARAAYTCTGQGTPVSVGGVTGFESLTEPSHSRTLRQSCRAALYIHEYIWVRSSDAVRKGVLAAFEGAPIDAEFGLMGNSEVWFARVYKQYFADPGIKIRYSHVNGFTDSRMDDWRRFVAVARRQGIQTVAPVFSPNSRQYENAPFATSKWDYLRAGAKLGGGLTTDSPPHFFLAQPEAYRQFVADELRWANAEGLHTTCIISPNASGNRFLEETKRAVDYLDKKKALPSAWVVENYNPTAKPSYPNTIGTEDNPQNVLGVALWLSRNTS